MFLLSVIVAPKTRHLSIQAESSWHKWYFIKMRLSVLLPKKFDLYLNSIREGHHD